MDVNRFINFLIWLLNYTIESFIKGLPNLRCFDTIRVLCIILFIIFSWCVCGLAIVIYYTIFPPPPGQNIWGESREEKEEKAGQPVGQNAVVAAMNKPGNQSDSEGEGNQQIDMSEALALDPSVLGSPISGPPVRTWTASPGGSILGEQVEGPAVGVIRPIRNDESTSGSEVDEQRQDEEPPDGNISGGQIGDSVEGARDQTTSESEADEPVDESAPQGTIAERIKQRRNSWMSKKGKALKKRKK